MRGSHLDGTGDHYFETRQPRRSCSWLPLRLRRQKMSQEAAFPLGFLLVSPRRFRQGSITFEHGSDRADSRRRLYVRAFWHLISIQQEGPSMERLESDHLFSPLPRLITSWPGQYQGYWATGLESVIPSSTGDSPTDYTMICDSGRVSRVRVRSRLRLY